MRRTLLGLALSVGLAFFGSGAFAQTKAVVVETCGTAPHTYTAGEIQPIIVDENGNLCSGSTAAGGVTQVQVIDENEDPVLWAGASPTYPGVPATPWNYAAASGGIVNTTTAVTIKAAAGASLRNYLTAISYSHDVLGAATVLAVRDGAGGTVLWRGALQTTAYEGRQIVFNPPLRSTANTLLEVVTLTGVTGAVYVNANGYVAE